jgi:hypothetical protein
MTNNYKFKDINLDKLITDIDENIANKFKGITGSVGINVSNLKSIEYPGTLNYRVDSTDISTNARAKYIEYTTVETDKEVDLSISGTTKKYTHFTAYLKGGSGGGGGSGGDGESINGNNISASASFGGTGGIPGYVALYKNIQLNNNKLYISVGYGGGGGTTGDDDNQPGRNGSPGNPGSTGSPSYIKLGASLSNASIICQANAGWGGEGGGGANSGGGNGNRGKVGATGFGFIESTYSSSGDTVYNSASYPTIDLYTGGIGGDNLSTDQPSTGATGSAGYVRVYLKYIA